MVHESFTKLDAKNKTNPFLIKPPASTFNLVHWQNTFRDVALQTIYSWVFVFLKGAPSTTTTSIKKKKYYTFTEDS